MSLASTAVSEWLASLTLAASLLIGLVMVALRMMRGRSAGARRMLLAAAAFGLLWAALSRLWAPEWTPGFLIASAPDTPLDAIVERVDSKLDGKAVPLELAAKFDQRSPLATAVEVHGSRLWPALMVLWAAGALACLFQRVRNAVAAGRVIRRAIEPDAGDSTRVEVEAACREAGMAPPRVKVSTEISGPFTCGVLRLSCLVLPEGFSSADAVSRKAMLRHELAHLRHGDTVLQVMLSFLVCAQWFNPLLHWLERRLRLECEKACDDAALRGAIEPKDYAALLLDLYQRAGRAPGLAATGGARTARLCREMMRDRVRSLADATAQRTAPARRVARLLGLGALCCGSALGATRLQEDARWVFRLEQRPLPAAESLIGHWTFDAIDDPQMRPVSVNASAEGRINGAFAFNGADSYVDLDPAVMANIQFPFTLCGWIRCDAAAESHAMIFAGSNRPADYIEVGIYDGRAGMISRRGGNGEALTSSEVVADRRWHHIAGVFHSAERRELYVDGTLAGEENGYRRRPPITRLQIGRNGRDRLSNFLEGRVDDIRIYATALGAEELRAIMRGDQRLFASRAKR